MSHAPARKDHVIVGIHVQDRHGKVPDVQEILTEYGCSIKTRVGLHDVHEDHCSTSGIILLETAGPRADIDALVEKLQALDAVEVQTMVFTHAD
jgi:ACT domain-containing protein